MGKSVARFVLPGRTAAWVLQSAAGYAAANRLDVSGYSEQHLTMSRGSKFWTALQVVRVTARDSAGGADVVVETWFETLFGEMNADPARMIGLVPRRATWRLATGFVRALGVPPESVFHHF